MRIADVQLTFPVDPDGAAGRWRDQCRPAPNACGIHCRSTSSSSPSASACGRASRARCAAPPWLSGTRLCHGSSGDRRAPWRIMLTHVLPNVIGPVLVIGTLGLGLAIIAEATLSFLGIGLPPTQPSLGTLIRFGNDFLFSGQWWVTVFPGLTLILMVLAINLLGDWLRDALNPRLR